MTANLVTGCIINIELDHCIMRDQTRGRRPLQRLATIKTPVKAQIVGDSYEIVMSEDGLRPLHTFNLKILDAPEDSVYEIGEVLERVGSYVYSNLKSVTYPDNFKELAEEKESRKTIIWSEIDING